MVNAIPERVTLESYVRGKTTEAIASANAKVNRALIGAALSIGANVDIKDIPGYAPLVNSCDMIELAKEAAAIAIPEEEFTARETYSTGSTDMGDLSAIMPVIHPYAGGSCGKPHGDNYQIADAEKACVKNAIWQLTMLELLLKDGAKRARSIISSYTPKFTKEEFLDYQDSINRKGERITYNEDGSASISLK